MTFKFKYTTVIEELPKNSNQWRATIYAKQLLCPKRKDYTLFGNSEQEVTDKANEWIEKALKGECNTMFWRRDTYTLWDSICECWSKFKYRFLDFGYVGKLRKYHSEHYIPLKKKWSFYYPHFRISRIDDKFADVFVKGWINKFLYKHWGFVLRFVTPLTESSLAPMGRYGLNYLFAYYRFPVGWKDKFRTPRFETNPVVSVWFLRLFNFGYVLVPDFETYCPEIDKKDYWHNVDSYWEQCLWTKEYCDDDIVKAKETWPWQTIPMSDEEGEPVSSWKDCYLLKNKDK